MDLFIFDLDGTLIDSQEDLVRSVNATLRHLCRAERDPALIASYVGNGAPVLIQRSLGPEVTEDEVQRGLAYFLDYYRDHMLDHTRPYPGVEEGLRALAASGGQLAVLTNKPVRFSQQIVEGLGWTGYFFQVYGGNSFEFKKPHPIGIDTLIAESGAGRERTIMVGDSGIDVATARNAGVRACGVTYGFQPETFAQTPPDLLIGSLEELAALRLENVDI